VKKRATTASVPPPPKAGWVGETRGKEGESVSPATAAKPPG
jgi:hypothetical protein